MNNITIGGYDAARQRSFAYYETLAGGAGAGPSSPGLSAIHTHMTNTLNTPVEALESTYPFRVLEYSVRPGSGGDGKHRGGDGLMRRYQFLAPAQVTIVSERRTRSPWGLAGGSPGAPGRNRLRRSGAEPKALGSKIGISVQPGDEVVIETPGGGGWGRP
jgi:N-methylhydantoinase B